MDEWGVDVCVSGSQKGLMLPAGMGRDVRQQKALEAANHGDVAALLFRLRRYGDRQRLGYFPYTPSLPMMYGLRESLAMIAEEGLENIFHRHAYWLRCARRRIRGLEADAMCQCA